MTKRKYQGELIRFQKSINRPLGMVAEILKPGYTIDDLREGFKKYYPYEWQRGCGQKVGLLHIVTNDEIHKRTNSYRITAAGFYWFPKKGYRNSWLSL